MKATCIVIVQVFSVFVFSILFNTRINNEFIKILIVSDNPIADKGTNAIKR